jgi:hypothetical protein
MPIAALLEFTARDLVVRYRASAEPQRVEVHAEVAEMCNMGVGSIAMSLVMNDVNHGAASGAEFDPAISRGTQLEGPKPMTPAAKGPKFHWRLELAGVAPVYLRSMVEHLAMIGGFGNRTLSMSIVGALPVDASPLCVTEQQLRPWFDDAAAYVGRWPRLPFRTSERRVARGAAVRVALAGPVTDDVYKSFEMYVSVWGGALTDFAAQNGKESGFVEVQYTLGRGKTELSARWARFNHVREPASNVMFNMLTRFHETVAPITEVELSLA